MKEKRRATALIEESGEINIWGSPVIKVYVGETCCYIPEDKEEIESAIAESIKYVDKSKRTSVLLLVEVIPISQRRRARGGGLQQKKDNCERQNHEPRKVPLPPPRRNGSRYPLGRQAQGNARVRRRRRRSGGEVK